MKTIIIVLTFISLTWFSSAQDPDYNTPFTEIVTAKEAYFEQLRETLSESEFNEEGGEYNEYQRWYAFWLPRIAPNGTMADYNRRLGDPAVLPNLKSVGNLDDWYELGPVDKPVAGISSIGGGDRGIGIVNSLIVHPRNPNKLLCNSKAGGLFYSANKGQNWTNAGSDKWWRSGCSAMEFAPDNENIWYASSTVGGSYYSPPIGEGGGIYRTVDGGLNWFLIADKSDLDPDPNIGAGAYITSIKVDPSFPNIGYIGTSIGLFKSTNINDVTPSAVVWTKIHNDYTEDIEFKTDGSSIVFITHKNGSGTWSISKSFNFGTTWTALPGISFAASANQIIIEVSEADPNKLFALDHAGITTLRIFDYSLGVWTTMNTFSNPVGAGHGLGVSNFNTNYIYASSGMNFRKSTDGGVTFTNVSTFGSTAHHVDVEDFVTPHANCPSCSSSANEVYVTTHGGVNYSNDNIVTLSTRSRGLGVAKITEPSSAVLNPERISMGLDHDGTVISNGSYSVNWTPGWSTVYGGDGGFTEIDYSNSDNLWAEPQGSPPKFSQNYGLSFGSTAFPYSNDFYTEMIQNQTYPKILYSKAKAGGTSPLYEEVYRSDNYGLGAGSIEQISDFQLLLPPNQWVWGIYPSRTNPDYLYANVNANAPTWVGHFYRTKIALSAATTVKSSWEELPVPSGGSVKSIDVRDENVVYISAGGTSWDPTLRLYRVDYTNPTTALSTMVDISGDPISGGLPDLPINSVVQELGSNGGIYVSTDVGVFYANNTTIRIGGTSQSIWTELGTNLPNIHLGKLEINYISNTIRVATPGRGIWEHDLWCPKIASANYSGSQTGEQYLEVYNEINSTASVTSSAEITYRAGTEINLKPGFIAQPFGKGAGYFEAFIHPCMYIGSSPNLKDNEDVDNANMDQLDLSRVAAPEIKIYPNPSDGMFTLTINNDDLYDVIVYNAFGMEVYRQEKTNVRELSIDLTLLESGVYFARCINNHDVKSVSFVKK